MATMALAAVTAHASDWPRFRGVNGAGVSPDSAPLPTDWSDSKNLLWSVDLPGPGSSCPIVVGDRVILTCWTGADAPEMVRHLLCYNRKSGEQMWDKAIPPSVEDEPYRGMFAQHGYASHTPVSDGKRIYCFFGLDGVRAFDMDGNELWHVHVGNGTDPRGWGTASSPILHKDKVIITAGSESHAMIALNASDGKEAWNQPADGLQGLWGTPVLCETPEGGQEIVLGVAGELWGVNPDTGKLRWYAVAGQGDSMCGSAIADAGTAYMLGERGGSMIAVKAGGKGDVSDAIVWGKSLQGRISTPLIHNGLIYWVANREMNCIDAKTGEIVYEKQKLQAPPAPGGNPAPAPAPEARPEGPPSGGPGPGPGGFGGGRGGRGGRGMRGGMGGQDYSSPIAADGKIYFVGRNGQTFVLALGREFHQLAVNKFDGEADYSASPAASDGQLFIRSSKKLYCVANKE
jgi:outer membrane protein assembly factor BamB